MYNSFGTLFRITTFGESHGKGIGVVIDGAPAGLAISEEEIQEALLQRAPGASPYTSPRKESDAVEILSGTFEGETTGAPITLWIENQNHNSSSYEKSSSLYRPGHANFTYLKKYGVFDFRGGGRASARETAARVAAGSIAKKVLERFGIISLSHLTSLGTIKAQAATSSDLETLRKKRDESALFCLDPAAEKKMIAFLNLLKKEKDSIGGVVETISHLPAGLGNPIYHKLEALLAFGMLSIPATKGFEIGDGFASSKMKGSSYQDPFDLDADGNPTLLSNHAGGTLGGISSGAPLITRVAFKPTSSIGKKIRTVSITGEKVEFSTPPNGRHDPCVAIRGVAVVEAMTHLVLVDALLASHLPVFRKCASSKDLPS